MRYLFAFLFLASSAFAADPVCNCGKTCTAASCAASGCPMGQCYEWRQVPGTQGDQVALFYLGAHCGSYRYSADVYMPLADGEWGKPCKLPTPVPKRSAAIHEHPAASFAPVYFAPIRSSGRSGGC